MVELSGPLVLKETEIRMESFNRMTLRHFRLLNT